MNIRRYIPVKDDVEDAGLRMVRFDDGAWVRYTDVDALLARIRAAVEAERKSANDGSQPYGDTNRHDRARAALDALLADGGA